MHFIKWSLSTPGKLTADYNLLTDCGLVFKYGGIMKRKSSESAENHCEKPAKMTRSTEKDKKYDRQLR
jgi:hypothetical protein